MTIELHGIVSKIDFLNRGTMTSKDVITINVGSHDYKFDLPSGKGFRYLSKNVKVIFEVEE
jgi:hypothetical protein